MAELPLIQAIQNGTMEEVSALLNEESANDFDWFHRNALICASAKNNFDIHLFNRILSLTHDVNAQNNLGTTALMRAVIFNRVDKVVSLVNHPEIDMNVRDFVAETALHVAVKWRNTEPLKVLLSNVKTDVNAFTRDGETAFIMACRENPVSLDTVVLLMNHPMTNLNAVDRKTGDTALHKALPKADVVAQLLSNYRVDPTKTNFNGKTPLDVAVSNQCIQLLQAGEAKQRERYATAWKEYGVFDAPLCEALRANDEVSSWFLFDDGRVDINKASDTEFEIGYTALHLAVKYRCIPQLFDKILVKISNVNAVTYYGETALHVAVKANKTDILKKLLNYDGIDYNPKDTYGKTPLEVAIQLGYRECVQVFINHQSFDINVQDDNGRTALHYAVEYDKPNIVKQLLNGGADSNITDKNDETLKDYAIKRARYTCVQLLENYIPTLTTVKQPEAQKLKHKYNLRF